jgi:predicted PurR-regulated permease PerM
MMQRMSKSWSRTTRFFVVALIVIGFLWFLWAANRLIGPLAIAGLLAYVLNPAVTFVNTRTRLKRNVVVLLVFLIFLTAVLALVALFAPFVPQQVSGMAEALENMLRQLDTLLAAPIVLFDYHIPMGGVMASFSALSTDFVRPDIILSVIQATTTNLAWVLLILVTTYYLLQDWPLLREWLLNLAPTTFQPDALRLYEEIRGVWQLYLRGQLRLMFIVGLLTGLGSAAIGLPGAFAFGLFAGALDVILSVGPAVVMAIAGLVAFFAGSTYLPISNGWFALLVLAVFGLIQVVENIWLRPRVMSNTLRMHPAIVFIAVVGSLALAGVLTALIVIPLLGSVAVLGRYLYAKILDIDPWPSDNPVEGNMVMETAVPVTEPAQGHLPSGQR